MSNKDSRVGTNGVEGVDAGYMMTSVKEQKQRSQPKMAFPKTLPSSKPEKSLVLSHNLNDEGKKKPLQYLQGHKIHLNRIFYINLSTFTAYSMSNHVL